MYKNQLLAIVLLGCIATQSNAQSDANTKHINWLALTHDSILSSKKLLVDKRIAIHKDKIPLANLIKGTVYLYCEESGALLHAFPNKDAYWVLVFPDPKATKFKFDFVDTDFLLNEGIDVKLLQQVLHMNEGQGMARPSTPFTLDVRFTAKWNRKRQTLNIPKP